MNAENVSSGKKKSLFVIGCLIIAVILLIVCVFGWLYIYGYMSDYEKHQETYIADKVLEYFKNGEYINKIEFPVTPNEFESETVVKDLISERHEYAKESMYLAKTENEHTYMIMANEQEYATFTLIEDETESDFGNKGWKIGNITMEYPVFGDLKIYAYKDCKVYVNGIELSSEYIKYKTRIKGFSGLKGYSELPLLCRYTVRNLIETPEIRCVDQNGNECEIVFDYENHEAKAVLSVSNEEMAMCIDMSSEFVKAYIKYSFEDEKEDVFDEIKISEYTFNKIINEHNPDEQEIAETENIEAELISVTSHDNGNYCCEIKTEFDDKTEIYLVYLSEYEEEFMITGIEIAEE